MLKNGAMTAVVCVLMLTLNSYAEMAYFAYNGQMNTVALIGSGKRVGRGTTDKIYPMHDKKFGGSWNIEFSGIMDVKKAGEYSFAVSSDDGSASLLTRKS